MTRWTWALAALLLAAAGGGYVGYRVGRGPAHVAVTAPLPEDAIPVEPIARTALPTNVVERVKWRTRIVQVPRSAGEATPGAWTVEELQAALRACEDAGAGAVPTTPDVLADPSVLAPAVEGRIELDATKHIGLLPDGETVAYGWTGTATALLTVDGQERELFRSPLDLEASTAVSSLLPPGPVKGWPQLELRLGVGSDQSAMVGATFYPWRGRFTRRLGAFLEYERAGVLGPSMPLSLGRDRGYWEGRLLGGVALRF
jgi:hypothetical protein